MPITDGSYVSPTWVNNVPDPALDAQELQAITDTVQGNQSGVAQAQSAAAQAQSAAAQAQSAADAAQTLAGAAMPIAGGTFTGNAAAATFNREGNCLRNIIVTNASNAIVSTDWFKFMRK